MRGQKYIDECPFAKTVTKTIRKKKRFSKRYEEETEEVIMCTINDSGKLSCNMVRRVREEACFANQYIRSIMAEEYKRAYDLKEE